jgi:hypothetical protein
MSRRRSNRAVAKQPELSSWSHAIERLGALVQAQELGNERLVLLAQFTLLEEEVAQARGTEVRVVPAWEALGNALADRAKAVRLEQDLDTGERQELASYDWTWHEIEAATDSRADLELVHEDPQLRLWRTPAGEQVAWERHPGLSRGRDAKDWRYVSEDVSGRLPLGKAANERHASVGVTVPAGAVDPGPGPGEPAPPPGGVALVDQASGQVTGTVEEPDSRTPVAAQDETLNEVLARLGYTTTPALFGRKDVVSVATGELVLEGATAGQVWDWLRQTGDETLGELQELAEADQAHAATEEPQAPAPDDDDEQVPAGGGVSTPTQPPPPAGPLGPDDLCRAERADELEALRNYACEIEEQGARTAALQDVNRCRTQADEERVRGLISATLDQEARVRREFEQRVRAHEEYQRQQAAQAAPAPLPTKADLEKKLVPVKHPDVEQVRSRVRSVIEEAFAGKVIPHELLSAVSQTNEAKALERIEKQYRKMVKGGAR